MRRARVTKHEFVQSDECEGIARPTTVRQEPPAGQALGHDRLDKASHGLRRCDLTAHLPWPPSHGRLTRHRTAYDGATSESMSSAASVIAGMLDKASHGLRRCDVEVPDGDDKKNAILTRHRTAYDGATSACVRIDVAEKAPLTRHRTAYDGATSSAPGRTTSSPT